MYGNEITAISQYAYQLYSERLVDGDFRRTAINAILGLYSSALRETLAQDFSNCVLDFGVVPGEDASTNWRVMLIEINPFEETTDGALFSWQKERDVLEGKLQGVEKPVVRVTEKARTGALVMIPRGWKDVLQKVEREYSGL